MINLISLDKTNVTPKVKDLYLTQFPKFERFPFGLLIYKSKKKNSDFFAIYDDSEYIGMLYLTYYKDIVYIFYLAMDPSKQSKGYGSSILQHLREIYKDKRLLLNIEKVDSSADNYEQRLKRKRFYEKNGFRNTDFEIAKKDIVYEILYSGKEVYEYEYHALFQAYLGRVLYAIL
ncbi:GNAT family N-acetyltransferase [Paenibacillus sp. Marseille-Q7038]